MSVLLCLSFIIPSFISINGPILERNVVVDELYTLSYESKAEQIISTFDSYEFESTDDGKIIFEGSINLSSFDFTGIDYLSTEAEETIKKYKTEFDAENELFFVVTQYIQDDIVVYEEKVEIVPYYDDYSDDYYVEMPDGTTVSVSETLQGNNLDECIAATVTIALGLTAKELIVLLAAVIIVAAPQVTNVVTQVITTVVSWVRSFWSWFRSLWTKKTTTVVTTIVYTISIDKADVKAEKYDKNHKYEDKKYYVAIADTVDKFLYVTKKTISEKAALAILTASTYVKGATKDKYGNFPSLVVSIYTPKAADALKIATVAGTALGSPGAIYHKAKTLGYFDHYHPGIEYTDISHPHAFFGNPL